MSTKIYIEGGGDSAELQRRCRHGFRRLLEKCGFGGRMPRTVACGGRQQAFDDFKTAHANAVQGTFVVLLIDSEDVVEDTDRPWDHLKKRDNWERPASTSDDQALLMVTCMEAWISADRPALRRHYGSNLKEAALPSLINLEKRDRQVVHDALCKATSDCANAYAKGKLSFVVLGELTPVELRKNVPESFKRFERILNKRL